ncbi:speckle-type POZ protein [Caerostris darwini]|uniref:Speckle-type POZ protein n=1 Tax=Caerostris darwini TaxID=1538125 RepID=A0AAV4PJV5_9ARAC|nr:speckle-type POZ protein [Caerostris darwini]
MSQTNYNKEYYFAESKPTLITCSIQKFSSTLTPFIYETSSSYYYQVSGLPLELNIQFKSIYSDIYCEISIYNSQGIMLLKKSLNTSTYENLKYPYVYNIVKLTAEDETFQKLKNQPKDMVIIIFRTYRSAYCYSIHPKSSAFYSRTNHFDYLKALAADIKNLPDDVVKKTVELRVGDEVETVNKAFLCARSPVFSKMFQNEMEEHQKNTIAIEDIRMPVLKSLVSFLHTGKLQNNDLEFLCDVYYAAHKYDISELRDACCVLLMPKVTVENVFDLLKMSNSYQDGSFKISMMVFICQNFETIFSKELEKWMLEEPKLALEVVSFLNIK